KTYPNQTQIVNSRACVSRLCQGALQGVCIYCAENIGVNSKCYNPTLI
ncbi:MAG: hypothetical protein ACI92Z_003783, partial [Paracoccaceae bacterium]